MSALYTARAQEHIASAGVKRLNHPGDLVAIQVNAALAQAHASLAIAEQLRIANLLGVLAAGVTIDKQDEDASKNAGVRDRILTRNLVRAEILDGLDLA